MSVACTSCGHAVPLGQFRCGKCGAAQSRDSIEDLDAPSELALESATKEDSGEHVPRESIVPRGTFASDEPAAPEEIAVGTERPSDPPAKPAPIAPTAVAEAEPAAPSAPGGAVVAVPVSPVVALAGVVGGPVSAQISVVTNPTAMQSVGGAEPRVAQPAARPPFLASEILREDLMPAEPGRDVLTGTLRVFGALGIAIALWTYGRSPFALVSVGALALLATSALRLPHLTRAMAVATIAGSGLAVACFWQLALGGGAEAVLLAVSAPLLAGTLFFRAWYRGSSAARGLVGASLLSCVAWAWLTADAKLLSLDWTVQSWLPALLWCVFVILCVLSLLAFMDDETTGACDLWATGLLVWYLVQAVAHEALSANASPAEQNLDALGLTQPIFAAPLAVAVAQLLARALGRQHRLAQFLLRRNT